MKKKWKNWKIRIRIPDQQVFRIFSHFESIIQFWRQNSNNYLLPQYMLDFHPCFATSTTKYLNSGCRLCISFAVKYRSQTSWKHIKSTKGHLADTEVSINSSSPILTSSKMGALQSPSELGGYQTRHWRHRRHRRHY